MYYITNHNKVWYGNIFLIKLRSISDVQKCTSKLLEAHIVHENGTMLLSYSVRWNGDISTWWQEEHAVQMLVCNIFNSLPTLKIIGIPSLLFQMGEVGDNQWSFLYFSWRSHMKFVLVFLLQVRFRGWCEKTNCDKMRYIFWIFLVFYKMYIFECGKGCRGATHNNVTLHIENTYSRLEQNFESRKAFETICYLKE